MVVCSNLQYSAVPRGLEPLEGVTPGVVGSATTGSPVKGTQSSLWEESAMYFSFLIDVQCACTYPFDRPGKKWFLKRVGFHKSIKMTCIRLQKCGQ